MRIIAGRWKGRRLQAPRGLDTRPTADRVREALFSILGPRVRDRCVIDLCCGSGALGLEALSRGASHAVFVDQAGSPLKSLQGNLDALGIGPSEALVQRADAVAWLRRELTREGEDLILLADPPYASSVAVETAAMLGECGRRVELAVLECERGATPTAPQGWAADRRRYGRTELLFLESEA